MAEVADMAEAGQIWQERTPKLDRPSLSFGTGQLWQKWQKWQENSIKRLSPKNNVTPYPDTGSGTIHSGLPDAYQNPLATKTANPQAFPTTSENVFLKRSVGDTAKIKSSSAISLPTSAISRPISAISFHPVKAGPVPDQLWTSAKSAISNKNFSHGARVPFPIVSPSQTRPPNTLWPNSAIADIIAPA